MKNKITILVLSIIFINNIYSTDKYIEGNIEYPMYWQEDIINSDKINEDYFQKIIAKEALHGNYSIKNIEKIGGELIIKKIGILTNQYTHKNNKFDIWDIDTFDINNKINFLYDGHDAFRFKNRSIIREFPIYKEENPNCCPTGGKVTIEYEYLEDDNQVVERKFRVDKK